MTTREQAMQWWDELDLGVPHLLSQTYYKGRATSSLTGSEIEAIWKCEQLNEAFEKDGVRIIVKPTIENIYLKRLREQYKQFVIESKTHYFKNKANRLEKDYLAMRLFCLDCSLLSFAEIEQMEYEVNQPKL